MNAPVRSTDRPERLRLSVDNFLLLNDSGAFADYGKTELIDGEIWYMNAQFARHARAKSRLARELARSLKALGSDLEAIVEVAVHLNDDNMPEPDVVLTPWRGDRAVPVDSVVLAVEVADTTLDRDLGRKAELYAVAGVTEYWVVDLNGRRVAVYTEPGPNGYLTQTDVRFGDLLVSATIAGLEVASDILFD